MTVGEITQKSGNNLLSVIVPVYNVTTCLDRCVNSIIDQSFQNFELILVNDGSTDGSGDKCEEWKKKDNRIQVVHQTNSGVSAARNHGLSHANGDSVIFLDADDYIERDMFSGMVSRLYSDKADIVCCGYYDDWSLIGGDCLKTRQP